LSNAERQRLHRARKKADNTAPQLKIVK
jgi:hypothetical protein